jgi:hypothetical protein
MVAKHSLTERPTRLGTGLVTATVLEGLVTDASEAVSIMARLFMSAALQHIKFRTSSSCAKSKTASTIFEVIWYTDVPAAAIYYLWKIFTRVW